MSRQQPQKSKAKAPTEQSPPTTARKPRRTPPVPAKPKVNIDTWADDGGSTQPVEPKPSDQPGKPIPRKEPKSPRTSAVPAQRPAKANRRPRPAPGISQPAPEHAPDHVTNSATDPSSAPRSAEHVIPHDDQEQLLFDLIQQETRYANACRRSATHFAHYNMPGLNTLLNQLAQQATTFAQNLTRLQPPGIPPGTSSRTTPEIPLDIFSDDPDTAEPIEAETPQTHIGSLCAVQCLARAGKQLAQQLTNRLRPGDQSPLLELIDTYHPRQLAMHPHQQPWAINFIVGEGGEKTESRRQELGVRS